MHFFLKAYLNKYGCICTLFLSFFCLSFTVIASPTFNAPSATTPRPHLAQAPTSSPGTSSQSSTHSPSSAQQIHWNFNNADIRAIISTVAALTHKSFVVDPRVEGKVSFISNKSMNEEEAYQAFLAMLRVLNYTTIPTGNTIKVVPLPDARTMGLPLSPKITKNGDNMMLKVVRLNNTNAVSILPLLQPFVSPYGNIRAYAPANSLMIADSATNINHIIAMINQLDQAKASGISIVSLQHATADKLAQAITTLQQNNTKNGLYNNVSLVADNQSNSILITGNQQSRQTMQALIKTLDAREAMNEGSGAQVIHLNYLDATDITQTLNKMLTSNGSSKLPIHTEIEADKATNSIIISGPLGQRKNLIRVIKQLDTRPQQVLVEAIIAEVSTSLIKQLGIKWGMAATETAYDPTGGSTYTLPVFQQGIGIIPGGNIAQIVTALSSEDSTNILATPIISVLNNQKASIKDGTSISVSNRSYDDSNSSGSNDGTPFTTQEYKNVGLSLEVTPRISPNKIVRLEINQENDSLSKAATATSSPLISNNPTIDTSGIKTSVIIKSGDILVMGGLIKKASRGTTEKVPILGDIPILGKLFQYKNTSGEKKDLMVFLRPIIISSEAHNNIITRNRYNMIRDEQLRQDAGLKHSQFHTMPLLKNQFHVKHVVLPPPYST